jgi:hypothetical protein
MTGRIAARIPDAPAVDMSDAWQTGSRSAQSAMRPALPFGPMSVLEFVASLVRSLAWPAAVIAIAILLRHQLRRLLTGPVRRMRAGPFELEWDRLLSKAEAEVDQPVERSSLQEADGGLIEELAQVATVAPGAAVMEAHAQLERTLRALLEKAEGVSTEQIARMGAVRLARLARDREVITPEAADAVEGMSVLRNLAAHGRADDLTTERALDYLALADAVLYSIQRGQE